LPLRAGKRAACRYGPLVAASGLAPQNDCLAIIFW
jgi:hypothetical protein